MVRNHHLLVASFIAVGVGLVLRLLADDWATVEFTTPEGTRASAVNHAKEQAFDWVGLALLYGGAGGLVYSLYLRYFGKKKAWRL